MPRKTTWILGNDPECDLVVDRPSVSWRHCQLTWRPDGTFVLEDLNSTNGTYVNGRRVARETVVKRGDDVTLGLTVAMPWPPEPEAQASAAPLSLAIVEIGRDQDNDLVIDDPEVSWRHARALLAPGGTEGVVEDLDSTNGTAVDDPSVKIKRMAFTPASTLYFGPVAIPGSRVFALVRDSREEPFPELVMQGVEMVVGRDETCDRMLDFPMISGRHARFVREGEAVFVEDLGSSNGTFVNGDRISQRTRVRSKDLIGLGSYVMQWVERPATAPIGPRTPGELAGSERGELPKLPPVNALDRRRHGIMLAGVALGSQVGVVLGATLVASRGSVPNAMMGLAIGGVWLGAASAGFEHLLQPTHQENAASHSSAVVGAARGLARGALFAVPLAVFVELIVARWLGIGGSQAGLAAVAAVTAIVGAAIGSCLILTTRRIWMGLSLVVGLLLLMGMVGPHAGPTGVTSQVVAGSLPARWAFEAGMNLANMPDSIVERYFPSASTRSGPFTCAIALLAMLGGWAYAAFVVVLGRVSVSRQAAGSRPVSWLARY